MSAWRNWLGVELSVVSWKERAVSALGGFIAIFVLFLISERALMTGVAPLIGSMGASAVLLFAVPHGQLSQPWPVIAGHGFSAAIGVACWRWIPQHAVAGATAVALSIAVMHQLKCIHPPGGATALTAVIGGAPIHALGFKFVLTPVLLSAVAITTIAVLFNAWFPWRRYPALLSRHKEDRRPVDPARHQEVVEALRSVDSFVDITEEDLLRLNDLLRRARKNPRPEENLLTTSHSA